MDKTIFNNVKKLLPFSDNEIVLLSRQVPFYVRDNIDKINSIDAFNLGICFCNLQFTMREIYALINDNKSLDEDRDKNIILMCELLNKYDDLVYYLIDKYNTQIDSMKEEMFIRLQLDNSQLIRYYQMCDSEKTELEERSNILFIWQ